MFQYFDQYHSYIHKAINSGGTVLVHCGSGVSRSSIIVIMYLMRERKMSMMKALNVVKQKRPIIRPLVRSLEFNQIYSQ
jgi:protein-tyrosine phosphatase